MDGSRLRDAKRWTVTLLPTPKRTPRARGFGLAGGFVVGNVEGGRGGAKPCWWPAGNPELLAFADKKWIYAGRGFGCGIPGAWKTQDGNNGGAFGWRVKSGGGLETIDLHPKDYARTSAGASGGGAFAGSGDPAARKGERVTQRALYWGADGKLIELPTPDGAEGHAQATDGEWAGGRVGRLGPNQRAAVWKVRGLELTVLSTDVAEVYAVSHGEQVGVTAGEGFVSRAALWRGSAASHVDLTPDGHEAATALGCHGGLQVGMSTKKATNRDGSANMEERAALWAGSAASHVDLHGFLPPDWSSSGASAIEVVGGRVRVAGHVTRREGEIVVAQLAVLWEADAG